jgi:hypothetical protein
MIVSNSTSTVPGSLVERVVLGGYMTSQVNIQVQQQLFFHGL